MLLFFIILVFGLYLRFHNIGTNVEFGWDQARDAWNVREILRGKLTFVGPRTGVGQFHLGPLYYYLLVPFYFAVRGDPIAANYLNFIANILNFFIIYWVVSKLFSKSSALLAVGLYALSFYMININRIPWNVTTLPGLAVLAYYAIYMVFEGEVKWIFILALLLGLMFQVHFTVVIFVFLLPALFLFSGKMRGNYKYFLLAFPIIIVLLLPNLLHEIFGFHEDFYRYRDFIHDYFIGFHFRFLLHRIPDVLIQFQSIFSLRDFWFIRYLVPIAFFCFTIFTRDSKFGKIGIISFLWLGAVAFTFTIYGGQISDYYFLITFPVVIVALVYLKDKLVSYSVLLNFVFVILLAIFAIYNFGLWLNVKPNGGLVGQKEEVRKKIAGGQKFDYNEGDIKSYIYVSWVEDGKDFK